MLDKKNNRLSFLTIVVGTILLFDIGTIISNIYIAPVLDGYGLPDIFIYLKALIFLFMFIILLLWQNRRQFNFTKTGLRILIYIGFFTIIAYFFSLFMYKYVLIYDTAEIIRNNILYGNPNLVFDFSAMNYKTLTYITTIFGGFNSEVILLVQALFFQAFIYRTRDLVVLEEKKHQYDIFLFDLYIPVLYVLLVVAAFLSINIFTFRYDNLGSIEMGISIFGFIAAASGVGPALNLYKLRTHQLEKSQFKGTYKLLLILTLITTLTFIALAVMNISFINLGRGSYRIFTSFIGLVISLVLGVKIYLKMSLDNK